MDDPDLVVGVDVGVVGDNAPTAPTPTSTWRAGDAG
jgi:hypothetical protein